MIEIVALWSHLLAACLYGALALWQLRHWNSEPLSRPLVTAFAVMSVWSIFTALLNPFHFLTLLADCGRNLAFLAFMYGLMGRGAAEARQGPVKALYGVVAAVIAMQIVIAGLVPRFADQPAVLVALMSTSQLVGIAVAAGALVLVHNLYGQAAPESRRSLLLPMAALAGMWAYDLHLYTAAALSRDVPETLYALRGAAVALLVVPFAMAMRRNAPGKVQLSRAATFQSLSALAILGYLIVMMSASRAVELAGGHWLDVAQIALLVLMSAGALVLLPSARARRWTSVMVQKHLFQHRYDYRQEWLRFTATIGDGAAEIEQRVAKAMADLGGAPAGLLLIRGEDDALVTAGQWNWPDPPEASEPCPALIAMLEAGGDIVDFTSARAAIAGGRAAPIPPTLAGLKDGWAGVPLVHDGRLHGLVVIGHPPLKRALDWEDFDLFRTAGRQAASYIAEARSLAALAEARRFDEFNRRFAFILHDIKNLVSQLSLVARNAERHADNPEFRADMVATLQSSVKKMNDLLARLAPGARPIGAVEVRPMALHPLIARQVEAKRRSHKVELSGDARLTARIDPAGFEQAFGHMLQNAIDASPADAPVAVSFAASGPEILIHIADRGHGMSAEFISRSLFQPFSSTKDGGFGIGAHEARALIEAMGGRIDVVSRPGAGTTFTLRLVAAEPVNLTKPERISA